MIRTGLREPFSLKKNGEWIDEFIGQAADALEKVWNSVKSKPMTEIFWHSGDDYFMENETDFRQRMSDDSHFKDMQM